MSKPFIIPTIFLSTLILGCSPTIDNRGYEMDNRDFTKILPGKSNKQFVEETLGSPSTISTFKPETWLYISKQTSQTSFFTPTVKDVNNVEITFNESGVVEKIIEHKGEHAREINPVKRKTPAAGHESGVLREVFSNFGKVSSQNKKRED